MAQYIIHVFNSLAPRGKMIKVTGILEQIEEISSTIASDGEVIWVLRLQTNANGLGGNPIPPEYVRILQSMDPNSVTEEVKKAVSEIAAQVDWEDLEDDTRPPYVIELLPGIDDENVSIFANVFAHIRDAFPTTGIDPSTIKMRVNGIDVTNEVRVTGIDNEYKLLWVPPRKLD